LYGNEDLFEAFDFRYNEAFKFWGDLRRVRIIDIDISSLSDQIKNLYLMDVVLGQKPRQPYRFVQLTDLELESMAVSGILGDFFTLPNLKHLKLIRVLVRLPRGVKALFSDKIFLQGSPLIETMVLSQMSLGDGFIEGLKSCKLLKSLRIKKCDIETVVNPLLKHSQSNKFLPSLHTLKIIDSWPPNLGMPFEGFRSRFAAKRPSVTVSDVRSWEDYSEDELQGNGSQSDE
jgi:hypothetical protein